MLLPNPEESIVCYLVSLELAGTGSFLVWSHSPKVWSQTGKFSAVNCLRSLNSVSCKCSCNMYMNVGKSVFPDFSSTFYFRYWKSLHTFRRGFNLEPASHQVRTCCGVVAPQQSSLGSNLSIQAYFAVPVN
jgi:hypothetical protein